MHFRRGLFTRPGDGAPVGERTPLDSLLSPNRDPEYLAFLDEIRGLVDRCLTPAQRDTVLKRHGLDGDEPRTWGGMGHCRATHARALKRLRLEVGRMGPCNVEVP